MKPVSEPASGEACDSIERWWVSSERCPVWATSRGRMGVVAEGPEMPHVWHLSLEEAKAALDAVGIPYRIVRAQNRVIPEGHLFSTAPVPGTTMRWGMEAVLTVSHGPPVVPDGA